MYQETSKFSSSSFKNDQYQPAPKITQTEQWEPNFYSEKHKYIEFKMSYFLYGFPLLFQQTQDTRKYLDRNFS